VWRTRVGYAGGDYPNPTYHDLGDQTECFQVDFDPAVISYAELLEAAFLAHNPTWVAHKVQYASLVLAHDDIQLATAREGAVRFSDQIGGKLLVTRVEPLKHFWVAEDYHQKYHLRNDRVLSADFRTVFGSDETALRESTAAARVNGYVAGDGTAMQLAGELESLGLSEAGRARLLTRVGNTAGSAGCSIDR